MTTKDKMTRQAAAFQAMSPARKRVTIAKDVLAALTTKKLWPKRGIFIHVDHTMSPKTQLRSAINTEHCDVCAMGALFVATVQRRNAITLGTYQAPDMPAHHKISKYLEDVFSEYDLKRIEQAFELGVGVYPTDGDTSAVKFGRRYANVETRMRNIMENIIKHKGTFTP